MRRIITAALLVALSLSALALGGCSLFSSPNDDANNAISEANVHFKLFLASEDKLQKLDADLNKLDISPDGGAVQALALTAQIRAELAVQKTELQEGSKAIAAVKTFDVDETFKKYADLEVKAIAAQIAVVDEGLKYYTETDRLYTAIRDKKDTAGLTSEIMASIDTISARITELSAAASKAKDEANAYFDKTDTTK
jgi:hypothetical protein